MIDFKDITIMANTINLKCNNASSCFNVLICIIDKICNQKINIGHIAIEPYDLYHRIEKATGLDKDTIATAIYELHINDIIDYYASMENVDGILEISPYICSIFHK